MNIMDIMKNIKWIISAAVVTIFVLICCIVGVFANSSNTTSRPVEPTNTTVSATETVSPTNIPTLIPTVDAVAVCKQDVVQWWRESGEVIGLLSQSMDILINESDLAKSTRTYLVAVETYQSIIAPECDQDVQLVHLRIGMMLLETGKALDSTSNAEYTKHITEANNLANQVLGLLDVVKSRYNLD
jgi:hypothetical protein